MLDQVRRRGRRVRRHPLPRRLLHFPFFAVPARTWSPRLHGRLDLPDLRPLYRALAAIAAGLDLDDQRRPLPRRTGRPRSITACRASSTLPPQSAGGYLAFLGRISPEKRPDRAIAIARRAGMPLKIAAKVDPADRAYFEERSSRCSTIR